MTRRNLIKLFAGLTGGAIAIPSFLYIVSPSTKKYASQIIFKELHYLNLDVDGVNAFVEDYFKTSPQSILSNIKWAIYYYTDPGTGKSTNLFETVRLYLLSSDFFVHKADKTRTVQYLGLYNPYKSPVPNPFSYYYV